MANETDKDQKPSNLYDFLYRDSERIASYYAQLWNGRLLSVEESVNESERLESAIKGSIEVAAAESKTVSEVQSSGKRTIDMHDAATVDLLLRLTAQLAERTGGLGAIHVFSGNCLFVDRNILKFAGPMIDFVARQESKSQQADNQQIPRQQRRHKERQQQKGESTETNSTDFAGLLKQTITALDMPSGFVLTTESNLSVCGPVKEIGLDQPISSLIFRAGSLGLKNTFVVGLVEEFGILPESINSPLLNAQREMGNAFFNLLFPPDAVRMIPLAIYRKIPI